MAVTENTYTGNGSTTNYSFTFPYLETSDIKVTLNGTLTTAYTLANATTVSFNTAPSNGVAIRIYRQTDDTTAKAVFYPGSAIRAQDLNDNFNQVLYSTQETVARRVDSTGGSMTGNLEFSAGKGIVFEGATDDAHETTLLGGDPTADRTLNLPNVSGTLVSTGDTGTVATAMIADSNVTTAKIADSNVTTAKIADANITTAKLADGSVTSAKIADGTIVADDIASSAVTTAKILDSNVTTAKIADSNVTTAKLADGAVTSAKIADGTIVAGDIATDAVITSKILDQNVTTAKIADQNVTTAKIADLNVTTGKINDQAVTAAKIADGVIDSTKLTGATVVTNAEHTGSTPNDTSFFTTSASDSRYFRQDSSETITSGNPWSSSDTYVATTAAIDARVIDLVDDVGGFVPITNETSFPLTNPDINNPDGSGTIISIKEIVTTRTPASGTVTIANGAGSNTVTINGCGSTVLASGFGVLVETTSTLHTYNFHRLVPKATEVTTVAGISGDITTVATNNANVTAVAGNAANINTVSTNIANVNNVGGSIANVNSVASNLGTVNDFAARYRVASSDPVTSLDTGDLVFNTTSSELRVYNGTSWQGGVTATGNLVSKSGDTMTGPLGVTAGTAALPSLFISGDPNTGIYSPGADQVSVATGGTERLRIDSTGQIEAVSLGTAAAPTFSFTGDPDTGVYSPGANQLAISTGGSGRLFIDSSGRVGIGTSPSETLHINGNAIVKDRLLLQRLQSSDNLSVLTFSDTLSGSKGNNLSLGNPGGFDLLFHTGGAEKARITSTGALNFVGAGTAGVTQAVSFNGSAPVNSLVVDSSGRLGVGTSSPSSLLHLSVATAASDGTKGVRITNPAGTAAMFECGSSNDSYIGTTSGSDFSIRTNNTSRIYVTNGGNVGIGTATPGATLSVASGSTGLMAELNSTNANGGYFSLLTSGSVYGDIGTAAQCVGGSASDFCLNGRGSRSLVLGTNNTERARIDSSGRLLVGTSTGSGTALFEVRGNISGSTNGGHLRLSRGEAAPASGDGLGFIDFSDNTSSAAAQITARRDGGTWSASSKPSRLEFSTTADGASSPTERLRIANNGAWGLAGANYGSSGQVLKSNGSGSAPTWQNENGKILQVVQTVKSDTFSTSSSSFTDVTGLSASITPANASNKILVIIRFTHSRSSQSTGMHFRITRGGAAIFVGDSASSRTLAATGSHYFDSYVQVGETITFLDSPSTTSSATYALQCKSIAGITAYVNRSGYDADRPEDARTASSIILMEVAA